MKIILDVMGFENPISEPIIAARKFIKRFKNVSISLVGNATEIRKWTKKKDNFEIIDCQQFVKQDDNVLEVLRNKQNSSMAVSIDLVKEKKGGAVVSAGSTPAFIALSYSKFGLINGIRKPAFTPTLPSLRGNYFNMLDVGANIDVDCMDLVNFAIMGSLYVKHIKNVSSPSVGLLNIATEDNKGLPAILKANKILKNNTGINYIGLIEPRTILKGDVDIIVSDGFTGNICLKTMEGSFKIIFSLVAKTYLLPWNWLGALFSLFTYFNIYRKFNYKNNAGAIVLGLKEIAIKTHGGADWRQFYSSLELAKASIEKNINNHIEKAIDCAKKNKITNESI
ncbi:MAG: phosphate acyltransferase PlsX [Mycoplasmoidaceae bacterium]